MCKKGREKRINDLHNYAHETAIRPHEISQIEYSPQTASRQLVQTWSMGLLA